MFQYLYPDAVLLIFCKAPIAGQVKTRLIPTLTAEQAMQLHIELSLNTFKKATQLPLCPVQLWCTPSIEHDFFIQAEHDYKLSRWQQQGDDLGQRMSHALCTALKFFKRVVLIGCDSPSLSSQDLASVIIALNETTAVFAPAEDGGYVLLGLNRPQPELFIQMPWGSELVMAETRVRCQQSGIVYHEMPIQWDVDTPRDLTRYRQSIQHSIA
jgi:rSAM/selenodomain-associated transferase 1